MSIRSLLAISCCLIVANESLAQYQQPAYQYPQFQQQPMMNAAVNAPGMYQAAARMRQDQAMQPPAPMMQAPVYQAPQNGFTAPPQLAPSMVAPSCGSDYMGHGSCGCGGGNGYQGYDQGGCDSCAGGSQVGQDYFDCDASGCGASAECGCGRYLRVFGGWNWLQDVILQIQTAQQFRLGFNDGWAIGGAIGQYMTENSRRELEFTYRHNTIDGVLTPTPLPLDGHLNCYSLMGNLVYELPRLQIAGLKPYIGGGVGVAYVDGEAVGFGTVDDTVFAYQGFFGVDRQLSGQAKLFAEYRYFGTSEFDIEGPFPSTDEYQANNLFFGLQLNR